MDQRLVNAVEDLIRPRNPYADRAAMTAETRDTQPYLQVADIDELMRQSFYRGVHDGRARMQAQFPQVFDEGLQAGRHWQRERFIDLLCVIAEGSVTALSDALANRGECARSNIAAERKFIEQMAVSALAVEDQIRDLIELLREEGGGGDNAEEEAS